MKQAVKFTFDTHFGDTPAHAGGDTKARANAEAELDRARSEGYAAGFTAGEAEATARADGELGNAMQQLASSAANLLAALDAQMASTKRDATSLALEIARKLAPALIATRPQAEIKAVLRDCLTHLNREPHILLRVSSSLIERLKDTVDQMAMERGLSGRIILLGETSMSEGDCVVEWADGGVIRSKTEIEQEIADVIARYIETISGRETDTDTLAMPEARDAARE